MSLYKSTNEMFNNSTLYHSDEYLGEDYTDGIKHWKYIKREKRNGRWVYYYEDPYEKNLNNAKKELTNAQNKRDKSFNNYDKAVDSSNARFNKNVNTIRKYENSSYFKQWTDKDLRKKYKKALNETGSYYEIQTDGNGKKHKVKVIHPSIETEKKISSLSKKYYKDEDKVRNAGYKLRNATKKANDKKFERKIAKPVAKITSKTLNTVSKVHHKGKKYLSKLFK